MAIVSPKTRLVYYDVTKVGSTSIKELFYRIETGTPFVPRPNKLLKRLRQRFRGQAPMSAWTNVHKVPFLRTHPFDPDPEGAEGFHKFAVVRDPIGRFVSAWRGKIANRVHGKAHPERAAFQKLGLPAAPDLGTLIDHIDSYREVSPNIFIHTTPFAWHLGPSLGFFDSIHRIDAIAPLERLISDRFGTPVTMPTANSSRPPASDARLTRAQIDRLCQITEGDYVLLQDHYRVEDAIDRLELKT
ncbi:sulfotransferase family protein [Roseibacterium beibuensis]|uniref:sulfotransferase family protein n=1 Tax=[Roseibacterium] beibuensis TaxID=1193142 RepID=UPI00217D5117|nr:sulfotransferase family protein [Roseibacterium beibuensis]MCS6622379.1 sulfotransferase family protein [Roseibacterium beibuensis]